MQIQTILCNLQGKNIYVYNHIFQNNGSKNKDFPPHTFICTLIYKPTTKTTRINDVVMA